MKKIIIGLILIPLSLVAPAVAALIFLTTMDQGNSFTGPGSREIVIEKPGKYYLWNQFNGTLDGVHHSQSETTPDGATFILVKTEPGKDPTLENVISFNTEQSLSTTMGQDKRVSIGYFDILYPGQYTLTIAGFDEKRLFAWAPSLFDHFLLIIGGFLLTSLIMFALIIGGTVLIIIGIIQHSKKSDSIPST